LFDPVWRKKVMKKYEVTLRQLSVSSPTEKVVGMSLCEKLDYAVSAF
jgi:hypothetical protein